VIAESNVIIIAEIPEIHISDLAFTEFIFQCNVRDLYSDRKTTCKHFPNCMSGVFTWCLWFSSFKLCLQFAYI